MRIKYINVYFVSCEALLGVLGNRGNRAIISGEQGNKGQILRGTGEQRQYWGTGNIRKQIFDFWGTGNKPIYFRGTREQVPPGRASLVGPSFLSYFFQHQTGAKICKKMSIYCWIIKYFYCLSRPRDGWFVERVEF